LRLLLDTHAALWFLARDSRLSATARDQLIDADNRVFLSAAVVWEVAVKRSVGKVTVPSEYVSILLDLGAQPLAIGIDHAAAVERLPWHHRDPFDRMLVAQAQVEQATIVSADDALAAYGVSVIW
jgi:PIN domain nuclease of toxin-antitoxin system